MEEKRNILNNMQTPRLCEIYSDNHYTLHAVESLETTRIKSKTGGSWYGSIKPTMIIVHGPDGTYALDMDARRVDPGRLKENFPELDKLL